MEKYYIEICEKENPCYYVLQSEWFDTEEQAIEWAKKIVFLEFSYDIWLMSSEWDLEEDTYTDIECVRNINKEIDLCNT